MVMTSLDGDDINVAKCNGQPASYDNIIPIEMAEQCGYG